VNGSEWLAFKFHACLATYNERYSTWSHKLTVAQSDGKRVTRRSSEQTHRQTDKQTDRRRIHSHRTRVGISSAADVLVTKDFVFVLVSEPSTWTTTDNLPPVGRPAIIQRWCESYRRHHVCVALKLRLLKINASASTGLRWGGWLSATAASDSRRRKMDFHRETSVAFGAVPNACDFIDFIVFYNRSFCPWRLVHELVHVHSTDEPR
jgi:hypothetical protein